MPLKSLTINGFKSFANKTKITFDSGITGIVGPNGSGKSNITEALRFVMGEASAKSMRGGSLKDVIFNGTENRTPINRAEVTLEFDNSDHQLALESPTVVITRRVYRNNESEYLINQKNVRLKDLQALFLDSRLSKDSLSLISQGRVEEIFNSKPEKRRTIIEEAAGLLHFKQQKIQAEGELAQTTDNLVRISDLINEIKGRVEPLHEQSSLAKEYQQQQAQFDRKNQQFLALKIRDAAAEKEELANSLAQVNQEIADLDHEVERNQTTLTSSKSDLTQLEGQKNTTETAIATIKDELAEVRTNLKVGTQSTDFDQTTVTELQQQVTEVTAELQAKQEQLHTGRQNIQTLSQQLTELEQQQQEIEHQLGKNPQQLGTDLEQTRNDYVDLLQEQTSTRNELTYLTAEQEKLQLSLSNFDNNLVSETTTADQDLTEKKSHYQEQLSRKQELTKQQTILQQKIKNLQNKTNQQEQATRTLSQQIQRLELEQATLERFQANHQGYYSGVKNILNHPQDFSGIIGTIGDLIDFDEKYQDALSLVLGNSLQSVVVQTQDYAKAAILTLKNKRYGRATFLPLDVLRVRNVDAHTLARLEQQPGFLGVFSDLLTYPEGISRAMQFLLGTTLVATDVESATQISRAVQQRYKVVTLAGDILNPSGVMSGGAKQNTTNQLLDNSSKLKRVTAQLTSLQTKAHDQQAQVKTLSTELTTTRQSYEELTETLRSLTSQLQQTEFEIAQYEKAAQKNQQALKVQQLKEQQLQSELQEVTDKLVVLKQKDQQLQTDIVTKQAQIQDQKELLADFEVKNAQLQDQLKQLLPQVAVLETQLKNENFLITDLNAQITSRQATLNSLDARLVALNQTKQVSQANLAELRAQQERLNAKLTEQKDTLVTIKEQLTKRQAAVSAAEQLFNEKYQARKIAAIEQEHLNVQVTRLETNLNHDLAELSDNYHLSYEAVVQKYQLQTTELDAEKLAAEIKLHQMSLAEIGPVNLNAIAEYEEVKERFDFLTQQLQDLLRAKEALLTTMSEIDQEVVTKFDQTFTAVNQAFGEIFPIMFGGGYAKLVLTDPEDLLTTGIEIIAQPPGKKLQQLSLLSGGERALTAITLLFAILKINPVPFCVLDEVEASLDEANVVRFAKFLQKYDSTTQFIVITHRKGTMEQADQLFGVVMQESGVSKTISVSLNELKERYVN